MSCLTSFPRFRLGTLAGFVFATIFSLSVSADPNGKPFAEIEESLQGLDARLDSLSEALDNHLSAGVAVEVAVDCAAGEQISPVLSQYADQTARLNIAVRGLCNETVVISRDNVILRAAEAGAGIVPQGDLAALVVTQGADRISVEGLTLSGARYGAIAAKGTQVHFVGVQINGSSDAGLLAVDNAVADVSGSTIQNANVGISAARGAVVKVDSSVLQQNTHGVISSSQATVLFTNTLPDLTPSSGVVINQAGGLGAYARFGGQITLGHAQIQGAGFGLYATAGGLLHLTRGNRITGNQIGIEARADTTVALEYEDNVVSGNLIGTRCSGDANYFLGANAEFTVQSNNIDNQVCLY